MSYQCATTLLYAVTRAQESGHVLVHMFLALGGLGRRHPQMIAHLVPRPADLPGSGRVPHRVDRSGTRNTICPRAARRGGTFHFAPNPPSIPNERARVVTSHLLPTYARVDLAFERGEGAWLIATNGERYLDFTGGVAVTALGHAHPHLVEALTAQAHKAVARLQSVPDSRGGAPGRAAVRRHLRRPGVLLQFRRRGDGVRDQDRAQVPVRQRPSGALPHHHLRRRLPRPDAGDARRRRAEEISRRVRSAGRRASTRFRSAISRRSRPPSGRKPRRS